MYKNNYQSVGQEEFGPPKPTVLQTVTQTVQDISKTVEESTGLRNFAYYAGVALIGYVVYRYMNE